MANGKARLWRRHCTAALLGAFIAGIAAGDTLARPATEVRASVALAPTHPVVAGGWEAFQRAVAANKASNLSFRLFVSGAMVGSDRALKALSQGEIDMGFLATPDYPEEFPYAAFIAALSMVSKDGIVAAAAATELVMLRCRPCRDEFTQRNLAFLGTYSAAPYLLMSKEPLSHGYSLSGRRVWSPGTPWDSGLREMAASPTRTEKVPSEALATGAADAVIEVPMALRQPRLAQHVRAVTLLSLGVYRGASPFTVNREFWRKLDPRQRAVLLAAAPVGLVAATAAYDGQAQTALDSAQERGVTLVTPDDKLSALVDEVGPKTMTRLVGSAQAHLGVTGAGELVDSYRELYAKYAALLPRSATFDDAVGVFRREIFAKLDPAAYAVEGDSVAATGDTTQRAVE